MMVVQNLELPIPTTSYANAGGTGNRTASIAVTCTQDPPDQGILSNLVDGAFAENATDAIDTPGAGATAIVNDFNFVFDFGVSKYIDEIKMYFGVGVPSNGQWRWFAVKADGVTASGALATFTWNTAGTRTFPLTGLDADGYRYYILIEDDTGKTWSNTFLTEIEFKIAPGAV